MGSVTLTCDIHVAPFDTRPDIPELIDHRTIPSPQPDVTLYLFLEETPSNQELQMYITCPLLSLNQKQLDPLPLNEFDLAGIRQFAIQVAAASTNAAPSNVLMSLQALGATLFDQLMPRGHQLRNYYRHISQLAAVSSTPLSWLVISDNRAVLPWELICPYFQQLNTFDVIYDDFLASKFIFAHWIGRQGLAIMNEAPIGWLALSHYNKHLDELSRWRIILDYDTPETQESMEGLHAFLHPDLPYYGLHILRYTDLYEPGKITYAGAQEFASDTFQREGEKITSHRHLDFTLRRPILSLSLIDYQQTNLYSSQQNTNLEASWFLPFMYAGVSALVGPRWTVPLEIDQLFFSVFYNAIREDMSLGQAVWVAREQVRQVFPYHSHWLAYTYFGHPQCAPYRVRPARGFTLFEILNHPVHAPLEVKHSYQCRASYRTEAPLWHEGRLHTQQEYIEGKELSVMVVPLTGEAKPEIYPLEPVSPGNDYQCILAITTPDKETTLPLLVQFQRGDEELRTMVLNFNVTERQDYE
jgi:hypothetical protein